MSPFVVLLTFVIPIVVVIAMMVGQRVHVESTLQGRGLRVLSLRYIGTERRVEQWGESTIYEVTYETAQGDTYRGECVSQWGSRVYIRHSRLIQASDLDPTIWPIEYEDEPVPVETDRFLTGLQSKYGYERKYTIEAVIAHGSAKEAVWERIEELAEEDERDFVREVALEALASRQTLINAIEQVA